MRYSILLTLFLVCTAFGQPKGNGWMSDYSAAKAEAKRTGRPMFVVIRCEPCVDFAKFDPLVQRMPELSDEFVCVRLTRITAIDLSVFEFDYDLAWVGLFMSANEVIYGRYGGRDETGDKNRLSLAGLKYAADIAIKQHRSRSAEKRPETKPVFVEQFAAAKARKRNNCIHCHEVTTFQWADARKTGTWSREHRWMYPLPENLGIRFEIDRGDRIEKILENSAAAKAGLKSGDIVSKLNGYPIASFADAQFALHKAGPDGSLPVEWRRGVETMKANLELAEGWKKTEQAWRTSMLDDLPTLHFSGDDVSAEDKKALGLPENRAAVRHDKFVHSTLRAVGVQVGDILVGVDGRSATGTLEDLLALVRREHLVGDRATLNLIRAGKAMEVKLTLK